MTSEREVRKVPVGVLVMAFALFANLLVLAPAEATAEGSDETEIFGDDFGPGSCSPGAVARSQVTTCRFPLLRTGLVAPSFVTFSAILEAPTVQYSDACFFADDHVVCPDLPAGQAPGTYSVALTAGADNLTISNLATVTVEPTPEPVLYLASIGVTMALTGPTTVPATRSELQPLSTAIDLVLRRPGSSQVAQRVRVLDAGDTYKLAPITIAEPGRWLAQGCEVAADGSCRTFGLPYAVEAIDSTLQPLFPGHNDRNAERIDLVFVGNGFQSAATMSLLEEARRVLSFGGEPFVSGFGPSWGPFSIEPLRGQEHQFNFWYLNGPVPVGVPLFLPDSRVNVFDPADLGVGSDVVMVTMSRNVDRWGRTSRAYGPAFDEDIDLGPNTDRRLGSIYLAAVPNDPYLPEVFAHELGHALFGLQDEYSTTNPDALIGYPNCQPTEAAATGAWGSQIGELDPMYYRWIKTSAELGFPVDPSHTPDRYAVGIHRGGCFGNDNAAVFRPTLDSIMRSSGSPVFGAVNRARVEQVLAMWPSEVTQPGHTIAANSSGTKVLAAVKEGGELYTRFAQPGQDWGPFVRHGRPTWASTSVAIDDAGVVRLIGIKRDGRLLTRTRTAAGTWTGWTLQGQANWDTTEAPAIEAIDGQVVISAVKANGDLYTRRWIGSWQSWTAHGAPTWESADIALANDGTLHIAGIKQAGNLYTRSQELGQSWTAWVQHGRPTWSTDQPPSISVAGSKVALAAVKANGAGYTRILGDQWGPWERHGLPTWATLDIVAANNGDLFLVGAKGNGRLFMRHYTDQWLGWQTLGLPTWAAGPNPSITVVGQSPALAAVKADGRLLSRTANRGGAPWVTHGAATWEAA